VVAYWSPKMQAKATVKNRIHVPPVRLRPRYAPSAVKPIVTATSPITCPKTVLAGAPTTVPGRASVRPRLTGALVEL
jgi:hypothetical protein